MTCEGRQEALPPVLAGTARLLSALTFPSSPHVPSGLKPEGVKYKDFQS